MENSWKGKRNDFMHRSLNQPEKEELSFHSEGQPDIDQDGSQKFFSFNQSFTNVEHNNKLIQEKTNSIIKIKGLEDQVRSCRARSALWEKAKAEIISLNKFLKLSSISLSCSDSTILKDFFQMVTQMLEERESKGNQQKSQLVAIKKNHSELFEKLVEANKQKYELDQKIVQYEHQISKLTQVNESLREKSRAQSTQRSSKIKEFHEETILTIHQKELEVSTLEERNEDLRRQIVQLESQLSALQKNFSKKQEELRELYQKNAQLTLQLQKKDREEEKLRYQKAELEKQNIQQKQTELEVADIKKQLNDLVDQNISIREELAHRAQIIGKLRRIIENARNANEEFVIQQSNCTYKRQSVRESKLNQLLQEQAALKDQLAVNLRFGVNKRTKKYAFKKDKIKADSFLMPSSQQLLI